MFKSGSIVERQDFNQKFFSAKFPLKINAELLSPWYPFYCHVQHTETWHGCDPYKINIKICKQCYFFVEVLVSGNDLNEFDYWYTMISEFLQTLLSDICSQCLMFGCLQMFWDRVCKASWYTQCLQLFYDLHTIQPVTNAEVLYKLMATGFLNRVLHVKVLYKYVEFQIYLCIKTRFTVSWYSYLHVALCI